MGDKPIKQYGEWLSLYSWNTWATLTFARQPSPFGAIQAWRSFFAKQVKEHSPNAFAFAAVEEGRLYGRVHLHALLGGMRQSQIITPETWVDKTWRKFRGIARVCPYDPTKDASFYIAKYVGKEVFSEWEVSGNWPPYVPKEQIGNNK